MSLMTNRTSKTPQHSVSGETVNIGKGIKFVRLAVGIRQGEMAKRLGVSQNYMSLLENNKAEPSMALLRRISDSFGVPAGFLMWEDAAQEEVRDPAVATTFERIRQLIHDLQRTRVLRHRHERT